MFKLAACLVCASVVACGAKTAETQHPDCGAVKKVALPNTEITRAELVGAGEFHAPNGKSRQVTNAFCRVAGVSRPEAGSEIALEV